MNRMIRTVLTAVTAALVAASTAAGALATECVPSPGQEYVAPTYAVEAEYTRTIPGTDPVLGEPPVITPGTDAWTEYIQHPGRDAVLGEAPLIDAGQEYIAPTVECWGVYRHWITGKTKTSAVDLGFGWIKIGTENVVTDPGQPYIAPTYGERSVIEPAVPARTETIEHDAVDPVLGEPPVITPGTDPTTETAWAEDPADLQGEGWEPTGATRSGEGVTRETDPGQPYIAPVKCETPDTDPGEDPVKPPLNPEPSEPILPTTPQAPAPAPQEPAQPVTAPVVPEVRAEPASEPQVDALATTGAEPRAGVALAVLVILAGALLVAAVPRRRASR